MKGKDCKKSEVATVITWNWFAFSWMEATDSPGNSSRFRLTEASDTVARQNLTDRALNQIMTVNQVEPKAKADKKSHQQHCRDLHVIIYTKYFLYHCCLWDMNLSRSLSKSLFWQN